MKTIVNIVSEQTLPNYLFVKEMYSEGDKLIWIVSRAEKIQTAMQSLGNTLGSIPNSKVYLDEGTEENISYIKTVLEENISKTEQFTVNLTGGTKPMSLAVYDFFKNNCKTVGFYYIPFPKNIIVNLDTQESKEITYHISIEEYLHLYNLKILKEGKHEGYLSFEAAKQMFDKIFDLRKIYGNEFKELQELKEKNRFKHKKEVSHQFDVIKNIKLNTDEDEDECSKRAERIKNFIEFNDIPIKSERGSISGNDIIYITGGWFEDLIFYLTEATEHPDDIICGIEILKQGDEKSKNELDIVYTKNNKLYIRECKTAWEKGKMFNEIVYKATAIKSLLGLGMESSLFSYMDKLSEEERDAETLSKMRVSYFGKKAIEDELNKLN